MPIAFCSRDSFAACISARKRGDGLAIARRRFSRREICRVAGGLLSCDGGTVEDFMPAGCIRRVMASLAVSATQQRPKSDELNRPAADIGPRCAAPGCAFPASFNGAGTLLGRKLIALRLLGRDYKTNRVMER